MTDADDAVREQARREGEWFQQHKPELLHGKWAGNYVAVHGARVMDSDADLSTLVNRFFQQHGPVGAFFGYVGDEPAAGNGTAAVASDDAVRRSDVAKVITGITEAVRAVAGAQPALAPTIHDHIEVLAGFRDNELAAIPALPASPPPSGEAVLRRDVERALHLERMRMDESPKQWASRVLDAVPSLPTPQIVCEYPEAPIEGRAPSPERTAALEKAFDALEQIAFDEGRGEVSGPTATIDARALVIRLAQGGAA